MRRCRLYKDLGEASRSSSGLGNRLCPWEDVNESLRLGRRKRREAGGRQTQSVRLLKALQTPRKSVVGAC